MASKKIGMWTVLIKSASFDTTEDIKTVIAVCLGSHILSYLRVGSLNKWESACRMWQHRKMLGNDEEMRVCSCFSVTWCLVCEQTAESRRNGSALPLDVPTKSEKQLSKLNKLTFNTINKRKTSQLSVHLFIDYTEILGVIQILQSQCLSTHDNTKPIFYCIM